MLRILEHSTSIPRPISMIFAYPALDFNFTSWMSPSNIRVLRSEQSETHIPGIVHGKDHMRHKSPLSVVDDVESKSKRGRQKSWGQAIGEKLSLSPMVEKPGNALKSPTSTGWTQSLPRSMSVKLNSWIAPEGDNGDSSGADHVSEQSDSDDDDIRTIKGSDSRRDADKSLRDRVKTPRDEKKIDFGPIVTSPFEGSNLKGETAMETELTELSKKKKKKKKKAPVGTRLTMTSRAGYFQDRIVSPSMVSLGHRERVTDPLQMRAMAILYIGPQRNPDFETDYYISPILAPAHLLAHFPPIYLICGERDPFVDDTILFAGKVREAKRARRAQAQAAAQSRSTKYGEGLRMSTEISATQTPDHILRETDDDWVQIRIIEGWGHGFMQMTSLMREVDSVLLEMADWIDESFERQNIYERDVRDVAAARSAVKSSLQPNIAVFSPEEHIPPPVSTHVKPATSYKPTLSGQVLGGADLGAPLRSDLTSDDDDGTITFTPKTKRRNPPTSNFNPVPRRPSRESLDRHRSGSMPTFDLDETGSSGEAMTIRTPPLGSRALPPVDPTPKGSGAFAFFNAGRSNTSSGSASKAAPTPASTSSLFAPRRTSNISSSKPTNSLVAAAVAGARVASPALAAAGLVSENVGRVSEAEVLRRRRLEAVFGLGETDSADASDEEEEEEREAF